MKIEFLSEIFNSTLSCIIKCLRFVVKMINKKIIVGLFILSFTSACTSPTAMLGPAYTFSSSGNIIHSGFSYASNEMIERYTGKTTVENIMELSDKELKKKTNIKKKTLESEDFYQLVKNRVEKTNSILQLTNQ